MATRNQLLNGADFQGFEGACDTVMNMIKDHFAQADPVANMTNPVVGIIVHDTNDNKFYGYTGRSGEPYIEFLQRLDVVEADLAGPPSDADLDALFVSPAEVGSGGHRYVRDIHSAGILYHVVSDGINWWYNAMTMAV